MIEEIYKIIEEFPNYEVSNLGNVRNKKTGRILKHTKTKHGYYTVQLYKNGQGRSQLIHRIVMTTFNPIDGMENLHVDHIDFNPGNNCLDNLRWLSPSDNTKRKNIKKIEKPRSGKKVRCIETGIIYPSISEAARQLGISAGNISACCSGKRKTTNNYSWEFV